MRKVFFIVLLFSIQLINSQGNTVTVGNAISNYIKIVDVYDTSSSTVVKLEFNPTEGLNGTLHSPTGESPYVVTDKKGNRYALKSQSGWLGSGTNGFGSRDLKINEKFTISLFFNKLKSITDIYSLTEVDCEGDRCWNFYDIKVTAKTETIFDKTWIDYDVNDIDGSFGIKIHTKFSIYYMKDSPFYLSLRIMKGSDFVKTANVDFNNTSGQIELKKHLTPGYVKTLYKDETLFLPYRLLREELSEGVNNLKIDVDLFNLDGTLLEHLGFKEFTYIKR